MSAYQRRSQGISRLYGTRIISAQLRSQSPPSMTKARDDADDRSRSRAAENDLAPTTALAVDAEGRARRRTMGLPMIIIDILTLQP